MSTVWTALGSLAIISFGVSAIIAMCWFALNPYLKKCAPAAQSRLLLVIVLLPIAIASVSMFAYWEWPDTAHGAHLFYTEDTVEPTGTEGREHDDAEHRRKAEPIVGNNPMSVDGFRAGFMLFGGLLIGRFLLMLFRAVRAIHTSKATAHSLIEVARRSNDGSFVFPSEKPEAFVLGVTKPKLFVSEGLLSMPQDTVDAVMAHERAHMKRFDPLRHLVMLVAGTFHLPGIANRLLKRGAQCQELAADADAASDVGDGARVAQALVSCTRMHHQYADLHLAFSGGQIEERVHSLLADGNGLSGPRPWALAAASIVLVYVAVLFAAGAHHLVEQLTQIS